jgi:hypothetical protein
VFQRPAGLLSILSLPRRIGKQSETEGVKRERWWVEERGVWEWGGKREGVKPVALTLIAIVASSQKDVLAQFHFHSLYCA